MTSADGLWQWRAAPNPGHGALGRRTAPKISPPSMNTDPHHGPWTTGEPAPLSCPDRSSRSTAELPGAGPLRRSTAVQAWEVVVG